MERDLENTDKKYNKVLSSKLLAKIPKGEKDPVPTRPKRNKTTKPDIETKIVSAKRMHVGESDNVYRLDHAVTKTQKNILNAFGLTDKNIEYRANWISEELKKSMMKQLIN